MDAQPKNRFVEGRTRGSGSIFQRPGRDTLYIQYRDAFGRLRQESSRSTKLGVAERMLRQRLADKDKGTAPVTDLRKVKYEDARALLLADYADQRRKSLVNDEEGKPTICGLKPLDDYFRGVSIIVIGDMLRGFVDKRLAEVEPPTVNRSLALLRRALRLVAAQPKYRHFIPPIMPMQKENDPRTGFVDDSQFEAILSHLPADLHGISLLAYYTGVRKGEAQRIKWEQVDLVNAMIVLRHTKNGEPRTIPIPDKLIPLLESSKAKRPFPVKNFYVRWREACAAAGCPGTIFHDLRRSGVRGLVRSGVTETVAMKISGHKTAAVFRRYNIVSETDIRQAMAARQQTRIADGKRNSTEQQSQLALKQATGE